MSFIKQILSTSKKFTPADANVDWERVETLVHGPGAGEKTDDANSAVFACLMAIATAYPEPPLAVYKERTDGTKRRMDDSPLQSLLDMPTPDGALTMEEILFWTAWAKHVDGNAYWLKVRSGNAETGNVIQLWPISPTLIRPISEDGEWISYYKYKTAPGKFVKVPPANIIHFRLGIDDADMRMGLAPLKALVRQVSTDEEADKFVEALLKNYAVPGLVVIPSGTTQLDQDDADIISEKLRRKFGSDQRGNVAVMSRESTVQQFGFSPDDLNLTVLHRVPEERISAVLGVPAIVAGLGAGLDRATYDNARSMGEWFTERKLVPQWRSDARRLNISLKNDFTPNPKITIGFDLTDVRALQEDEDSKYKRLQIAVGKPWLTRNEAREDTGFDAIEGWNDEDISPPEPAPASPTNPTDAEAQAAALAAAQTAVETGVAGSKIYKTFDIPFGGPEHKAIAEKMARLTAADEKKFAAVVTALFKRQQRELAKITRSQKAVHPNGSEYKAAPDDWLDDPLLRGKWVKEFQEAALPVLKGVISRAGEAALEDLELGMDFDSADPEVVRFLKLRAQRFAERVNESTWEMLKDSLADGITAGESIDELATRVTAAMADRIRSSPETIARTEVIGASNGGMLEAWKQTEVVEGKKWLAALDDRTRPTHLRAHGQEVAIDEDFEVGDGVGPAPGQMGVAEEDINCRCTMIAVLK